MTKSKTVIIFGLYFIILSTLCYGVNDDLVDKYTEMMHSSSTNPLDSLARKENRTIASIDSKEPIDAIRVIVRSRKNTFETTKEFLQRRSAMISEFNSISISYAKNMSDNFSVGKVSMKHYDPDTQIITLSVRWRSEASSLLSEPQKIKTLSLFMDRNAAQEIFGKRDNYPIHINLSQDSLGVYISSILLSDKYQLYKKVATGKEVTVGGTNSSLPHNNGNSQNECIGLYEVTVEKLNIRNEPAYGSNIVGNAYRGDHICIYELLNGWGKSKLGWLSSDYLTHSSLSSGREKSISTKINHDMPTPTEKAPIDDSNNVEENSTFSTILSIIIFLAALYFFFAYWQYILGFVILIFLFKILVG